MSREDDGGSVIRSSPSRYGLPEVSHLHTPQLNPQKVRFGGLSKDSTMPNQFAQSAQALNIIQPPGILNYGHDIDPTVSPGVRAVQSFMLGTLAAAEAFNERRRSVDETITYGANLAAIDKIADKIATDTVEGLSKARAALASSTQSAEAALEAAIGIRSSPNAAEVRSVLRGLSTSERSKVVRKAFSDGDHEVIGAIVGQSALLHGCDAEQVAGFFEAFKARTASAEYVEVQAHRKAARYLEACRGPILQWLPHLHEGTEAYAKRKQQFDMIASSYGF